MESFYPSPYRPIMARRKRSLDEMALATKSDSDDDDYSDREVRAKRTSRTKSKKSKPSKRNRRQGSDDDDIVSDDEEMLSEAEDMSFHESELEDETNAQRNARGLVARRAATKRPAYNENASTSEDELGIGADDDDEEEEDLNPPQKKRKSTIVTLKIPNTDKMLQALEPNRRTTRRTRGASEDIYALTNSGRHMEAVGRATHSPEADEPLQKRRASRETRASKNVVTGDTIVEKTGEYEVDETMTDFKGSQVEIMESAHASFEESAPTTGDPTQGNTGAEEGFVPESENGDVKHDQEDEDDEDDEDDEGPTTRRRMRASRNQPADEEPQQGEDDSGRRRSSRKKLPRSSQRKGHDEESDFEPEEDSNDEDDESHSEAKSQASPRKGNQTGDDDDEEYTSRRPGLRKRSSRSRGQSEAGADVAGELAEELHDLRGGRSRRRLQPEIIYEKPRRNRKNVDYRIIRPDIFLPIEEAENEANESPSRRGRGGGGGGGGSWQRTLFPTYGPFGGAGPSAILGPADAPAAIGGVDSDSSDDEGIQPVKAPGAALGHGLATPAQPHGADPAQGSSGTPGNLGKIKDKQALADADPLGVDLKVNFENVGGLQGHIDQLKEMVSLPLLYPEIFQRFHIVPPRGVLFHGPPGTGKTLLARALANSVSSEGRNVTFYMRKGADALSKWVGEAERQLRLLFEEARKTQPSIIFFDEIDGK